MPKFILTSVLKFVALAAIIVGTQQVLIAALPIITTQPTSKTVTVGATANFSVAVANGGGSLTYQWRKNGVAIPTSVGVGARTDRYTTPAATLADSGSLYSVVVSNNSGTATSANATLTVTGPVAPTVTTQPSSTAVAAGATATFSVIASGTAPLSYQWRKNGSALSGATAASYTTPATVLADSGSTFSVVVSNAAGSATSANATLTVNAVAPSITSQPAGATVASGDAATFSVGASGSSPFTYQWRKNGSAIPGATSASYTTPATVPADSGAAFSVVVSNSVGSVASANALLTVNQVAPAVATPPANLTVAAGQTATFSVLATGSAPLTVQWLRNGVAVSGATASTYAFTTTSADHGAAFKAVVSNPAGTATSATATLTVNDSSLAVTPASVSLPTGGTQTLSASLDGVATPVAWAATGGTLSTTSGATATWTAPAVAGTYTLTASKTVNGVARSFTVPIRVTPPVCTPVN